MLLRFCIRTTAARRLLTFEAAPVAPLKPPPQTPNVMHGTRLATDPRWRRRFREDLYRRRVLAGPEPERPRSVWSNWNRRVELSALRHRLGLARLSGFTLERLDSALTFAQEKGAAAAVGSADAVDDESPDSVVAPLARVSVNPGDNAALLVEGRQLIGQFCDRFLAAQCPHVPERLRRQAIDRLCSDASLATVGGHLGLGDLLIGVDTRPSSLPLARLADAFAALVASANQCEEAAGDGRETAWRLVRDFLLTSLHEADINEWWSLGEDGGEQLLGEALTEAGVPAGEVPEYRLMRQSAPHSPVFACFQIGLYIRRELLASGFGETPRQAKSECVSEALKVLFDTGDGRAPFNFRLSLAELTTADSERPKLAASMP